MSNYGVSTTTRIKDDSTKVLKLNRISLDSRKSKNNNFARKKSLKAENERYGDQKYLIWSE